MRTVRFDSWYNKVIGKAIDVDGVFSSQCVDVPKSYVDFVYNKLNWQDVGITGNGKDIWRNAKDAYFEKKAWKPGNRFRKGTIVCFGATPNNKYGHVAVCISRWAFNRKTFKVIEQNGFNPSGVAYVAERPYTANLQGRLKIKNIRII